MVRSTGDLVRLLALPCPTFVTNRIYKQMLGCPDFGKDWLR